MIERSIEIIGMCRSGHHGVELWIEKSFGENTVRYNNVNMLGLSIEDPDGKNLENITKQSEEANITCLLFNREDYSLDGIDKRLPLKVTENVPIKTIIVVRDPYNWAASRMVLARRQETEWLKITKEVIDRYKTYLYQTVNLKSYFKESVVCVKYNNWFSDENYRRSLSVELNLPRSPDLDECSIYFSSFNDEKTATLLKTNRRWEHFVNDEEYLRIFKDKELVELSSQCFGFVLF